MALVYIILCYKAKLGVFAKKRWVMCKKNIIFVIDCNNDKSDNT